MSILRSLGGVIAGLVVSFIVVVAVEGMGAVLHPFPPGADMSDMEVCRAHVAKFPAYVLVLSMIGWGISAFAGSWVATRLGTRRHMAHGLILGGFLLVMAVVNMSMLPYPVWFWGNIIVLPVSSFWGARLARERRSSSVTAMAGSPED